MSTVTTALQNSIIQNRLYKNKTKLFIHTVYVTVYGNEDRILLVSRFDNLGKGASGAAIECMNISMGADPAKGLNL